MNIKTFLRWLGVVVLPLPVSTIVSTFVKLACSSFGEPDDSYWAEVVSMVAFGFLLPVASGMIAPKFDALTSRISVVVYFIVGMIFVVFGNAKFLEVLPGFIGLIIGFFAYEETRDKIQKAFK